MTGMMRAGYTNNLAALLAPEMSLLDLREEMGLQAGLVSELRRAGRRWVEVVLAKHALRAGQGHQSWHQNSHDPAPENLHNLPMPGALTEGNETKLTKVSLDPGLDFLVLDASTGPTLTSSSDIQTQELFLAKPLDCNSEVPSSSSTCRQERE